MEEEILQLVSQNFFLITKSFQEHLHINKLHKLEEMVHNLLRLNHEEIESLKISVTSMDIESVIKTLQQRQLWNQMAALVNSSKWEIYSTFSVTIIPLLSSLSRA